MRKAYALTILVTVTMWDSPVARAQYCEAGNQFGDCGASPQESNCGCDWFDDLESYALGAMPGNIVTPVNGWENWSSSGASAVGVVSDAQNHTSGGSKSLRIDPNDDQVRIMAGGPGYGGDGGLETDGVGYDEQVSPVWTVEAWNYVPAAQSGDQFLTLLSRYDGGMGTTSWNVQTSYNAVAGVVTDQHTTGLTLPLVTDQWVRTEVLIDLQNDTMDFFYNDTLLYSGIWSIGDISNPFGNDPVLDKFLGVVGLFSNAATAIYWDDFSVSAPPMGTPVRYVDQDAVGANNGTSWAHAYTNLQSALTPAVVPAQVWVAEGTYRPGLAVPRTVSFALQNNLEVYGGFDGTETMLSQRDPEANVTVLSGDLNSNDIVATCTVDSPDCDSFGGICDEGFCIIAGNNDENSYHVVTGSGTNATAVLDGFTITGGNADGTDPDDKGAGMYNDAGSPSVSRCTFTGNSAANAGGGMCNINFSSPRVTDSVFIANWAESGGGLFNYESSNPTVVGSTFVRNSCNSVGGGLLNTVGSNTALINCTFAGNVSGSGGGGIATSSPLELINCVFAGNSSDFAGAISSNVSSLAITNCTFSGNTAESQGGAISTSTGNPTFQNCIFWSNSDSGGMDESAQIHVGSGTPVVNYSIVQGGWTGAGGTGNGSADPLFFDADGIDGIVGTVDDDLRPTAGSPAIDAGDNFTVPADVADLNQNAVFAERTPIDLAGNPRFVDDLGTPDTGVADPPTYLAVVDMGAHEFLVDCNHNGVPDDVDIAMATSLDVNMDGIPDECAQWDPPLVNDGFWGTAGNWVPPEVPDNDMSDLFDVLIQGGDEVVTLNIDAEVNSLKLLDDATLNVTQGDLNVVTNAGIIVDGNLNVTGAHTLDSAGPVVVDDSPDVFALGGCVPPPTVSLRGTGGHSMSSLTVQECAQVFAGDGVTTLVSGPVLIGPGGLYGPDPARIDPSAADLTCNGLDITGSQSDAGVFELDDTMTATVNGDVNLIDGGSPPSLPARLLGGCVPPPTLRLRGFSTLTITGSLNVSACSELSIGPNVVFGVVTPSAPAARSSGRAVLHNRAAGPEPLPSVLLNGDLTNRRTEPDGFQWRFGELVLSSGVSHRVEASGEDRGADPEGFTNNYTFGRIELAPTSSTTVVDDQFNGSGGEAMYVGELVLQSGSTLTLDSPLYAGRIINNGGTILTPGQVDTIDCLTGEHCDDGSVCTSENCSGGGCTWSLVPFGDANADGGVDIFDILCVLDGFAGVFTTCGQPNVDLAPCPAGDEIIDIFDILAVLDAFAGDSGCCGP